MEQPQIVYIQSEKSGSFFKVVIVFLLLSGLAGAAYYFLFRNDVPALATSDDDGAATGGNTDLNNSYVNPVTGEKTYTTPPVSLVDTLKDMVNTALPSTAFPLKIATGADLHKVNPYVKDVQQYCNKFGGMNLDVDGAFGKQTEAAVQKLFGTKTISREQYNNVVAPPLGKPTV